MTDRIAANATRNAVQAAVDAAVDGDRVLIPDGSEPWTSGISTTKQIIIRAQHYTPTPAGCTGWPDYTPRTGASSRNVTITNNSSSALFSFTTGNSYHCGVGGIRFNEGTGRESHISVGGTGTKVPLVFDCYFQSHIRYTDDGYTQALSVGCRGGVLWNCVLVGLDDIETTGEGTFLIKRDIASGVGHWNTDDTIGTKDGNGDINFYVEDTTFKNVGNCPDIDDHGRFTCRYSIYDGAWAETHGQTSLWGGRHWDFHDMLFQQTTAGRNLGHNYFWARAGTGVFYRCKTILQVDPGYYGYNGQLDAGEGNEHPPEESYPQSRQAGRGHNGTAEITDPIRLWGGTGGQHDVWQVNGSLWEGHIHDGTEVIVGEARPGYTTYTYHHPFRSVIEGGGTRPQQAPNLSMR